MNTVTFQTPQSSVHPSKGKKQLSVLLGYDITIQALNYHHSYISKQLRTLPQAVPARTTWRRPLWSANLRA